MRSMTFDQLMTQVLAIIPNAQFDEDNFGQIIIYTDLTQPSSNPADELVPYNAEVSN